MKKEKICPICQAFNDKNYIPAMVLYINKLIKSKQPTEVLNKQSGLIFNDYRYKTHREKCLINFEIPIEEKKVELKENIQNTKKYSSIDTKQIIQEYRNMSIEDKEKAHLKNIDELKYLIGYIANYNLINDCNYKGFIPKEDVSNLKILTDIILKNNTDNNQISSVEPLQIIREVYETIKNKE